MSGGSCLGCVQMGVKPLVYWVQTNGLALTSYERVRGWTHALGVDVPICKNANCVVKKKYMCDEKDLKLELKETSSSCRSWTPIFLCLTSRKPENNKWVRTASTRMLGRTSWWWGDSVGEALHRAINEAVFELRSKVFEPIACVLGS